MRLVAEGLSNQQIARRLVVSEATVKTHLNHVLSKLDVDGRPGLVAWAWRNGLAGRPLGTATIPALHTPRAAAGDRRCSGRSGSGPASRCCPLRR